MTREGRVGSSPSTGTISFLLLAREHPGDSGFPLLLSRKKVMRGALLNAVAILVAGLFSSLSKTRPSIPTQLAFRWFVVIACFYLGGRICMEGVLREGPAWVLRQLVILLVAVTIGKWIGTALKLQERLNRLGRFAAGQVAEQAGSIQNGLIAAWILFGLNPLAFAGPLIEAWTGSVAVMAVKAGMDALGVLSFPPALRWGSMLSVVPTAGWIGLWFFLGQIGMPWLQSVHGVGLLQAVSGVLVLTTGLHLAGWRRIALADYLPGLVIAPLLAWATG